MYRPSGDSSGPPPPRPPPTPGSVVMSARRHAPLPSVCAAHTARSPPFGSCDGFATQPARFCPDPRTNVTIDPSSDRRTEPTSTPSSSLNLVTFVALKSGADAAYTLRIPRSYATHAILSAFLAALTSSGDDGDMNASMVFAALGTTCAPSGRATAARAADASGMQSLDMNRTSDGVEAESVGQG